MWILIVVYLGYGGSMLQIGGWNSEQVCRQMGEKILNDIYRGGMKYSCVPDPRIAK